MTSSKQQTIQARIAREATAKVMQFFDGTRTQALHEILQNARRSPSPAAKPLSPYAIRHTTTPASPPGPCRHRNHRAIARPRAARDQPSRPERHLQFNKVPCRASIPSVNESSTSR